MRRHSPSLASLLAFEASARHRSFSRAAAELCVTQGAISKLIKALEAELGVLLFVRQGNQVQPTATADAYFGRIQPLLQKLEAAAMEIKAGSSHSGRLNLAVLPSLAARWLMPRYSDFSAQHPDIVLNLTTHLAPFDFMAEDVDAAILFGASGSWNEAHAELLLPDAMVPICSAEFLRRYGPFADPRRLLDVTLLHLASRAQTWRRWFDDLAVTTPGALGGPMFEHYLMIIQAVGAGLGAGLVPFFLVAEDLQAGRLVVAHPRLVGEDLGYYLVHPRRLDHHHPLMAFRTWVLQQCALTGQAIDAFGELHRIPAAVPD